MSYPTLLLAIAGLCGLLLLMAGPGNRARMARTLGLSLGLIVFVILVFALIGAGND